MTRTRAITAALCIAGALLGGCAPRGVLVLEPVPPGTGTTQTIIVGSTRAPAAGVELFSATRSERLGFARFEVSVPPERAPGTVTFPRQQPPDPRTDFIAVSAERIADRAGLIAAVNAELRAKPPRDREVVVFVHGFNTNFPESLFRHAQMRHDFDTPGLSVLYAWPSAANLRAYGLDRETALFARDGLEELLTTLARADPARIIVVGHSMGALIVMDTLRQMAMRDSPVLDRLAAIVLFAPDLDIGLFRTQMRPLVAADIPTYVFTSSRDRALRFSAFLRGQDARLGSIRDSSGLSDLPIVLIDITGVEATADRLGHFKVATSPSMIALIRGMDEVGIQMFRDQEHRPNIFETTITAVQEMTEIVLQPVAP